MKDKGQLFVNSLKVFILIICSEAIPSSLCVNLRTLFQPKNAEVIKVMNEELDQFKTDMTKSFMQTHSRRKRALDGEIKDIDITTSRFQQVAIDSVGPFSTFTFAGRPYVIKRDGIYELQRLSEVLAGQTVEPEEALVQRGTWTLRTNELVLNGFEWQHNFLIVTTTGKFSTIYTLHENSLEPIFRQNILNQADAVKAEFFDYRWNLYMVILNDNEMHSTTFSPVYRWAGSYMDEIHQVQTTGASAVKTFTISGKEYIAIAQSQDSTGNTQVGTMVLSMDHMDRLERVQLLWSNGAQNLHYMRTEKEHFLVVGQEKESSIVYWFGGMDFIFWQQFDGLQGKDLVMEGLQLTDDEPLLLTTDGTGLRLYSRSVSPTKIMTTWVATKTIQLFDIQSRAAGSKIVQMKILRTGESDFLAITQKMAGSQTNSLMLYPVNIVTRPITVSQTKTSGDSLSRCMDTLKTSLKDSEQALNRIDQVSKLVLTTDNDLVFDGEIASRKIVKPMDSKVKSAEIMPDIGRGSSDRFETSPSKLLEDIKQSAAKVEAMKSQLSNVLYKSKKSNVITGNLAFINTVDFGKVDAMESTDITFATINGVVWNKLNLFGLRTSSSEAQQVVKAWSVDSLRTSNLQSELQESKLSINNFMMKSCQESQIVSGDNHFDQTVKAEKLEVQPETKINDIQYSDVVFKENANRDIEGFKHAPNLKGAYSARLVNNVNLQEWFSGIARISGSSVQRFTGLVTLQSNSHFDNLLVEMMNEMDWNKFQTSVMLDGEDQVVKGLFNVEALKADQLRARSISGVGSDDILTSARSQHITSSFTVDKVQFTAPLSTTTVNKINLADVVKRNAKVVEINGQTMLENFQVQDIIVPEGIEIAGKDVSELFNLKKVHKYSTVDNRPIILKQVQADRLNTDHIDNENVADFTSRYWSRAKPNVANPAQLILDNKNVKVAQGNFKTGRLNHFAFPNEFVSLDQGPLTLRAPLRFQQPVEVTGDVTMEKGAKIQEFDMSEAHSMIVDEKFTGPIRGTKTFMFPVKAVHGANFDSLNGMDPRNDVVMLNSQELQQIDGVLKFENVVTADQITVTDGNVHVNGLVNQVSLADVKEKTAYLNKENRIDGDLFFDQEINANEFSTGQMNNLNIETITDNMLFLNHPESQFVEGHVIVDDANADFLADSFAKTINSVPVEAYMLQVVRLDSVEALISGTKTFLNVKMKDRLMCKTFNNVDLVDLESNAFSRSRAQIISGSWSLQDAGFEHNLDTQDIAGISLDNLAFTNEPFEISSPVKFTSKQTTIQGPVSVTGAVNGIQFDERMKNGIALDKGHSFDKVIVDGSLTWTEDKPELQRLSYLFKDAVTKSGSQKILGKTTFREVQSSEMVTPNNWLKDVDLQEIRENALMTDSSNLVVTGVNEFVNPLQIQNLINPVTSLDAQKVNNIDLKSMSEDIVQENDLPNGKKVQGRKKLLTPMLVKNLKVQVKISDIAVSNLVLVDNPNEISQVQFQNLEVEESMDSDKTNGLDLKSLLDNRVSLTKPNQDLQGSYALERATVESTEGCRVPVVNQINVNNIMKKSKLKSMSLISGKKVFKNLKIEGQMQMASLNKRPVQTLVDSTVKVNRAEKIARPVIFEAPVIVNQGLKVETINDINLKQYSAQVSERISRLISEAQSSEEIAGEINFQALKLQQISQERPAWLEYLRMKQDLTGLNLGAQSRVNQVEVIPQGDIRVTLHSSTDDQTIGLPKGCQCNSVLAVNLKEISEDKTKVETIGNDNCLNVYNVLSPNKQSYTVISETMSSDITCFTEHEKSTTTIMAGENKWNMAMGHISDVGVFSEKEFDFLVMAQYFDKNTKSHSTLTRVLRVDASGNLDNVQNIETHGARKVALDKVNDRWMLAIANSKSGSEESSCIADSAIYMWSAESEQFILLRTIMTDGAFDVEFITTETSNEFYKQSFVAFAQQGNSASGEVIIYRYEQPGGNFVMSQTIGSKWPITGVSTMSICRQSFLVTTVPQEGITFYENRFVEGFQEYYKAPVFGANDIREFKLNDRHLFAIATDKGPIISEAVIAGSCPK